MTEYNAAEIWDEAAQLAACQQNMRVALAVQDDLREACNELADRHDSLRDFAHTLTIENDRLWHALENADPLAARNLREALA